MIGNFSLKKDALILIVGALEQKEYIEKAIYKTKKELNIHEIVIAYHAKEYVKQYLEYLKTIK